MQRLSDGAVAALAPFVARQDLRRMRVLVGAPANWLPGAFRMSATTLGPFVAFRRGAFNPQTPAGLALIAHEAYHITQAREMGQAWFFARYILGQFQCGFRHDRHPLEAPAIVLQRQVYAALTSAGQECASCSGRSGER